LKEEYKGAIVALQNLRNPIVRTKWAELTTADIDTIYKSICPVCSVGMLLVGRDQQTMELTEHDRCLFCGQTFQYTDIEEMREMDNGKKPFPVRSTSEQEESK